MLTIEKIESTIKKNKADLGKIASDKFEAGNRWNQEREAALSLFTANKLDPRVPLKGINMANTALVNAQQVALREPWTGKANEKITPPGTPPAAPAGSADIKQRVESSGQVYDPAKYDYRIVNGQVQRRAK